MESYTMEDMRVFISSVSFVMDNVTICPSSYENWIVRQLERHNWFFVETQVRNVNRLLLVVTKQEHLQVIAYKRENIMLCGRVVGLSWEKSSSTINVFTRSTDTLGQRFVVSVTEGHFVKSCPNPASHSELEPALRALNSIWDKFPSNVKEVSERVDADFFSSRQPSAKQLARREESQRSALHLRTHSQENVNDREILEIESGRALAQPIHPIASKPRRQMERASTSRAVLPSNPRNQVPAQVRRVRASKSARTSEQSMAPTQGTSMSSDDDTSQHDLHAFQSMMLKLNETSTKDDVGYVWGQTQYYVNADCVETSSIFTNSRYLDHVYA